MYLTPIVSRCSSNLLYGRGLDIGSVAFRSVCLVNPSMTILDVVLPQMELSENVLGCRVSSWFPRVSNGTHVVAEDSNGVNAAGKDTKIDHELLQPMRFILHFASGNIL